MCARLHAQPFIFVTNCADCLPRLRRSGIHSNNKVSYQVELVSC
ncbi:hypothetical protein QWZ13_19635 [Reinekea marina]|nr:hypothetical protein [Reinekea marina]MDN3650584.1 hypothetical protein [Reinekea marina]MDN3651128.1 hypothetical protein [Reinekea marina]